MKMILGPVLAIGAILLAGCGQANPVEERPQLTDEQFWTEYQQRRGPVDYADPVAAKTAIIDTGRSYCSGLDQGRDPRVLDATDFDLVLAQEMAVEMLCPQHAPA